MSTAVTIYAHYSLSEDVLQQSNHNADNKDPFLEVIGLQDEYIPYHHTQYEGRMFDFNVVATLEEFPEDAEETTKEITGTVDEENEELLEDMKALRVVRSIRKKLRKLSHPSRYTEMEDINFLYEDEDTFNVNVVWDEPYANPKSILKKLDVPQEAKPKKSVTINLPSTHKTGYHPTRYQGGGVYLRTKAKRMAICSIKRKALESLCDEVLAHKSYNYTPPEPPCKLKQIVNSPLPYVDFVVIVNSGADDFFVRIGHLELRRRFNYMENDMKVWYTEKKTLMDYCEFGLEDVYFHGYYVMFHSRFNEYIRVQVSSPVERDLKKNSSKLVIVALIDYGGHLYVCVDQLRPLMPYFAQFPKMAYRAVLSLTRKLEEKTGRSTYTFNEQRVFQNLIADYNGIVEAIVSEPKAEEINEVFGKFEDNGTFGIMEVSLFVMKNGKRKNIDDIILGSEEEQSMYLRGPYSHYPSIKEYKGSIMLQLSKTEPFL